MTKSRVGLLKRDVLGPAATAFDIRRVECEEGWHRAQVDAELDSAMTSFRVNAYASAQANPNMAYRVANQQ